MGDLAWKMRMQANDVASMEIEVKRLRKLEATTKELIECLKAESDARDSRPEGITLYLGTAYRPASRCISLMHDDPDIGNHEQESLYIG